MAMPGILPQNTNGTEGKPWDMNRASSLFLPPRTVNTRCHQLYVCRLFSLPLFCIVPHLVVVPLHALDTCLQTASQTDGRVSTIKEDEEKYKHSIQNTIQHHMFIYLAIEKRRSRDILSPLYQSFSYMIISRSTVGCTLTQRIMKIFLNLCMGPHLGSYVFWRSLVRTDGRTDGWAAGRFRLHVICGGRQS